MAPLIKTEDFKKHLNITLLNTEESPEHLNERCGADFVHNEQSLPVGWSAEDHAHQKCISFDGDADRQYYYYGDE